MSNSKYLDGLNPDEKKALVKDLYNRQNHKCFICEKDIYLDLHHENIDHVKPLASGGKDDIINFALTHEHCNKSKQDADLRVAKAMCKLGVILDDAERKKEVPSLKHVLLAHGGSKFTFRYKIENGTLCYCFDDVGKIDVQKTEIFTDSLSLEQTAFIKVPIEYLYHDESINPRGINSSIRLLIKEFHKSNPQLHLSLARIDDDKIKIFDGQHKAVAQIMLGVKEIVLRLFVKPDIERLLETNTNAGSKLKQIAFDKAIVRQLHDVQYAETIRKYQKAHNLSEDNLSFSEQALVDYFKGERGNVKQYIIDSQKNTITRSPENKLLSYLNFEGRGTKYPLSYSTFEKTVLSTFINSKIVLKKPINYKVDEGKNERILERDQLIRLCNIIAEQLLIDRYNLELGTFKIENRIAKNAGDDITDEHLCACRLFKEEVMYNWVQQIKYVIRNCFVYEGMHNYDDMNLFQREMPKKVWVHLESFLQSLRELLVWKDHALAETIFGGKNNYDYWKCVFDTGNAPDGTQVLPNGLKLMEMIKKEN